MVAMWWIIEWINLISTPVSSSKMLFPNSCHDLYIHFETWIILGEQTFIWAASDVAKNMQSVLTSPSLTLLTNIQHTVFNISNTVTCHTIYHISLSPVCLEREKSGCYNHCDGLKFKLWSHRALSKRQCWHSQWILWVHIVLFKQWRLLWCLKMGSKSVPKR